MSVNKVNGPQSGGLEKDNEQGVSIWRHFFNAAVFLQLMGSPVGAKANDNLTIEQQKLIEMLKKSGNSSDLNNGGFVTVPLNDVNSYLEKEIKKVRENNQMSAGESGFGFSSKKGEVKTNVNVGASSADSNTKDKITGDDKLKEDSSDNNKGLRRNSSIESSNELFTWKIDIGIARAISEVSGGDSTIQATLSLLYAGAQAGSYISFKKGSEFEKFVLAQGFQIGEDGKLRLTASFLEKVMGYNFQEFGTKHESIKQNSYGIDYKHNLKGFINDITGYVILHDSKGKNLGVLGDIIVDTSTRYDWTRVYGAIGGGKKLLTGINSSFKISDDVKFSLGFGYDQTKYDAVLKDSAKNISKLTTNVGLEYQPTNYDNFKISGNIQEGSTFGDVRYTHDFGNGFRWYAGANHIDYSDKNTKDDTRIYTGFNATYGGDKNSKLTHLFNDGKGTGKLSHGDIMPNSSVATENIYTTRTSRYEDHIVGINKTALSAGDTLEKNLDGTLKSLSLDNGGFAVSSILGINISSYSNYIQVVSGHLAIVDFIGLNKQMAANGLATGSSVVVNVGVADASGFSIYAITLTKGSVELGMIGAVSRFINNVTSEQQQDFVNGIKTYTQIFNEKNHSDTTPNAFDVPNMTDQALNTIVTTNAITVSGINASTAVSTNVGTLVINGTDTGLASSNVTNGQTVAVKLTTSSSNSIAINGTLTIGGVVDNFSVTTIAIGAPSSAPGSLDMTTGTDSGTNTTDNITNLNSTFTWASVGGATSYEVKLNTGSRTDVGNVLTYTTSGLSDGTHTFYVRGKNAGGVGSESSMTFTKDTITPNTPSWTTGVTTKSTAYTARKVTLAVGVSGISATGLSVTAGGTISNVSVSGGVVTFDYTTPNAVGDTITISGTSVAGTAFSETIDTPALSAAADAVKPATPTLTINSGATYTNNTNVNISITGDTDNVGVTGWFVSESSSEPALGSFVAEPTTTNISSGDGTKTLYAFTRDAAGNISLAGSQTITLDTVTPSTPVWTVGRVTLKNTAYTARKVTLAVGASGISATGLSVTAGGTISNVSVSGGVVTFDYTTPNAVGDTITISGTSVAGTAFSETIDTPALSAANVAPEVLNIADTTAGNTYFGGDDHRETTVDMSSYILDDITADSGLTFNYTGNAGISSIDTSAWPTIKIIGNIGWTGPLNTSYTVTDAGGLTSNTGTINTNW